MASVSKKRAASRVAWQTYNDRGYRQTHQSKDTYVTEKNGSAIQSVMTAVLEPAGLDEQHLNSALGTMLSSDVDAADLYFQLSRRESWMLEDSIIKEGSFSVDQGVGVRAVSGEKTGFAYSDELVLPALQRATRAARAITRQGQERSVQVSSPMAVQRLYPAIDPTTSVDDARKNGLAGNARLGDAQAPTRASSR